MGQKHILWLYRELPELVSQGVLTGEQAERLRQHYGEPHALSKRLVALTIFGAAGAILIGAGIILLLAHNWEQLSRALRAALSLAPLLAGQILVGWTLWTGRESVAWREPTAAFLSLAIGASIALIGQTYHVPGDFGEFMFAWVILALPLVYLRNSSLTCILYMVGITIWACHRRFYEATPWGFWPLLALAVPHFIRAAQPNPYAARPAFLGWTLVVCTSITIGMMMEYKIAGLWVIVYGNLFALFYLAGQKWFGQAPSVFQKPLLSAGGLGIVGLSLLLTFREIWREVFEGRSGYVEPWRDVPMTAEFIIAFLLVCGAVALFVDALRNKQTGHALFGAMSIVSVVGFGLGTMAHGALWAMLLFNVYLFAVSVLTILEGIRANHLGTVNVGMLMLAALILARFFDSDIGFVARGMAFILIGFGFLAANVVPIKRGKGVAK
ncbi:MAG: DUF2157 domain-containing protein [Candidatus Sumerlaeia bacterium]|nr:DUF2157 domain-containing protein [Candidatus Sumerlaeia bacterium]